MKRSRRSFLQDATVLSATLTAGRIVAAAGQSQSEWWESRRTMSLKDLQLDAAKTSLERARRKGDTDAIRFLQEHLRDVQSGRCCPEGMGGT